MEDKKSRIQFMVLLSVFTAVLFVRYYQGGIDVYNTTMLALNYAYGFISRGLLGTAYALLDRVLPFSLMNAGMARLFLLGATICFFCLLLLFAWLSMKKIGADGLKVIQVLLLFIFLLVIPTFSDDFNFGRVDLFMISISVIGALLILYEKAEWLVVPLSAIAVMIHQGYVFMYFNIILALLAYRFFCSKKREKWKYGVLFCMSFVIASALFLYLELFSHANNGQEIYQQVAQNASALSVDGQYHETLLAHEILGVDLSEAESLFHKKNLVEIIIYTGFFLPYLVLVGKLCAKIYKTAEGRWEKCKYLLIFVGALTMVPDFLIKVDYGRWVLSVLLYYLIVFVCIIVMDDGVREQTWMFLQEVRQKFRFYPLLFLFPFLYVPFFDVNIDQITAIIGHVLNREVLHWW